MKFAKIEIAEGVENYEVNIIEQRELDFEYYFEIFEGTVRGIDKGLIAFPERAIRIASVDCIEYSENNWDVCYYSLYLRGSFDCDYSKPINIPKEPWKYIRQALELLGVEIVENDNRIIEQPIVDYSMKDVEPTKEEIKEMIDLVDLDTFCKIIKNRVLEKLDVDEKEMLGHLNRKWARGYLENWAKSKFWLYKLLGNSLTISKEIEVEKDADYWKQSVVELIDTFPLYGRIIGDIPYSNYAKNKLDTDECYRNITKDSRVKDGMKVTKFISLYGNKELDIELSKLYQDKGSSNIFISIDPVDYLTVSINYSGWESCHNFFTGCYRNAGLSYMFDETSLVSYVSRKKVKYAYKIPFEWNTKSWRQMIYKSKNSSVTVFSRQYPYNSDEIAKEVRSFFEEKVTSYFNSKNSWRIYSHVDSINVDVDNHDYALLYNDIDNGYNHKVVKAKDDKAKDGEDIIIGARVPTLLSGDRIDSPTGELITGENEED